MQVHGIKDPYVMPPQGETLRQYYLRRGYLGSFDDLSEASLMSLEQERKAELAICEMAKTDPMVFGHGDCIYKRFPDGRIKLVRRESANQPNAKQKASLPSTSYTGDQWMQNMMEGCKRLNSDEAYRKEVAKRQF